MSLLGGDAAEGRRREDLEGDAGRAGAVQDQVEDQVNGDRHQAEQQMAPVEDRVLRQRTRDTGCDHGLPPRSASLLAARHAHPILTEMPQIGSAAKPGWPRWGHYTKLH